MAARLVHFSTFASQGLLASKPLPDFSNRSNADLLKFARPTGKEGKIMKPRLDYFSKAPELIKKIVALNAAVEESGLEMSLLHLIKLRASQLNGCSFCVDMHSHEAREDGESEQRLYLVSAWKDSPLFTERERAAFAWTEALTLVAEKGVSDELYAEVRTQFSKTELVQLTVAIGNINVWNRLGVAFRPVRPA